MIKLFASTDSFLHGPKCRLIEVLFGLAFGWLALYGFP